MTSKTYTGVKDVEPFNVTISGKTFSFCRKPSASVQAKLVANKDLKLGPESFSLFKQILSSMMDEGTGLDQATEMMDLVDMEVLSEIVNDVARHMMGRGEEDEANPTQPGPSDSLQLQSMTDGTTGHSESDRRTSIFTQ